MLYDQQRIVDWLADTFRKEEGIDLLKDKQALQRLTETAEKAKIELSSLSQTNIRYNYSLQLKCQNLFKYCVLTSLLSGIFGFAVYPLSPLLQMVQNISTQQ